MVTGLKDWKIWALMVIIALSISISVRLVAESMSKQTMHISEELEKRLQAIEKKQHPATARRWTMDNELEVLHCLDNIPSLQRMCIKHLILKHDK